MFRDLLFIVTKPERNPGRGHSSIPDDPGARRQSQRDATTFKAQGSLGFMGLLKLKAPLNGSLRRFRVHAFVGVQGLLGGSWGNK